MLNKVIILEGPDGGGKTFLARQLQALGWQYHHEGPPPGDPFQHYLGRLLTYLRKKKPVVLDRFHLGEYVYGPVKRDTNYMTKTGLRIFDRICRAYNVPQVLCLPTYDTAAATWSSGRPEYVKDREEFYEVYYRYHGLLKMPGKLHHAWDQGRAWSAETLADWHGFKADPLPLGTIGYAETARFLVVGEQSNTEYDLPFCDLRNSSSYLNHALRAAGYPERDLVLTNAFDKQDRMRDLEQIRARMPQLRMALALGNKALRACEAFEIPCVRLPHPSQHKRFEYKQKDAYIQMLKEVRDAY